MADTSSTRARPQAARVLTALAHRWPTASGLAFMVFSVLDMEDGRGAALVVFVAALIYLGTALLGRPGVVWILFVLATVAVTLLRLFDVDPWPALVAGAVSVVVLGLVDGLLRKPLLTAAQVPAMLVFGAAALVALLLPPGLGGYLVAAALVGHATLDAILWRKNEVVARSMAEFCAVLDFTLGVAILVVVV